MEIWVISQHNWLITLLKQYFLDKAIIAKKFSDLAGDSCLNNVVISEDPEKNEYHIRYASLNWTLPRPISINDLIEIVDRLSGSDQDQPISIGKMLFFFNKKLCILNEQIIHLTEKEAEIISYLLSQDSFVDKTKILSAVWGYTTDITTHTLETHIYKLRSKFPYDFIISTGDGYKLASLTPSPTLK